MIWTGCTPSVLVNDRAVCVSRNPSELAVALNPKVNSQLAPGASVLMALGFAVAIVTYGTGRTTLLAGIVHLVLLATYVFTVFAP